MHLFIVVSHVPLTQSVPAVHIFPDAQRWHSVMPPQSLSDSPAFCIPSVQAVEGSAGGVSSVRSNVHLHDPLVPPKPPRAAATNSTTAGRESATSCRSHASPRSARMSWTLPGAGWWTRRT